MKSEFLESELELYVQRLLIHESYATSNEYRMLKISPNDERLKGYDAEIVGMTSFYCQFKTSDWITKGGLYKQRQNFCTMAGWPQSSFYSFALRVPNDPADRKNSQVWQHNVLHSLWKNNPTGVAYVAPLFHTRAELDLHEPLISRGCCLCGDCHSRHGWSGITIEAAGVNGHGRCRLPFFDGLVSIPPHAPVKDLKHSYCFTSPSDVTFHSEPERVGCQTLSAALESFVREAIGDDRQKITGERMTVREVRELIGIGNQDEKFLEAFLAFGLVRKGHSDAFRQSAVSYFSNEASWLEQRIAFSAALSAYFGISTLGLLKVEEY